MINWFKRVIDFDWFSCQETRDADKHLKQLEELKELREQKGNEMNEQKQLKTAKDLVELMDPIERAQELLSTVFGKMIVPMLHNNEEEIEFFINISKVIIKCIDKDNFFKKTEEIYTDIFSEEEIDEIYRFNQTSLGKKLSDNINIINAKVNNIVAEDLGKHGDEINKIIEKFVMKDM